MVNGFRVGRLELPAVLLHEPQKESVGVELSLSEKALHFSPELQQDTEKVVEVLRKGGRNISNGASFCFADVDIFQTNGRLRISAALGSSQYYYNLLHAAFDKEVREDAPELARRISSLVPAEQILDPSHIGMHPLSSGVGLTTVVRLADNRTVLTRRSEHVAIQPGRVHVAVAEGFSSRDVQKGETIDLRQVVLRSLKEELLKEGTQIEEGELDVHIFGLMVDLRLMWPGFLAEVRLPLTSEEIGSGEGFAPDKWERDKIWFPRLDLQSAVDELKDIDSWTGGGSLAVALSLIKEFGEERVNQAFS